MIPIPTIGAGRTHLNDNRMVSYPFHSFSRYSNRNHKLYSINVKAFTLSDKAYKYMNNLSVISNMSGSLFSPNPGEMASNIRCETNPERRVEGYITASLATSSRAFLDSRYFLYASPATNYLFVPDRSYKSLYYDGYYPVDMMTIRIGEGEEARDVTDIFWGPVRCIDCVAEGGTKQKPDYWP